MYTVLDFLRRDMTDRVAIVDGARRLGYAELRERSRNLAGLLQEKGLHRGDRVAIFLPRSIDAVTALFATWLAGGVGVIVYERLLRRQVEHIVGHSGARFLITNERQLLHVPEARHAGAELVNLDREDAPGGPGVGAPVIGADLASILYTSGSTGLPKGVMLSHANLLSGAQIVADYLDLDESDIVISLLPFSFDYGLNQLLTTLLVGGTLVLQRSLFPPDICKTLQRERVSGMAGVPTLWRQLSGGRSPFLQAEFPDLRYVTNTGGALPESLVRQMRKAHPHVDVHLMYGLTEAFRSTHLPPEQLDARPSSIGKAIPNVEILVVDEQGNPCAPGEVGELVHRGANIALGYWRDPEATARVFRPHPFRDVRNGPQETVVYSGDLVWVDAEGYLYFVGRRDQLIKSRGLRVSPEEVEGCVHDSGLVAETAVFGDSGDGTEGDIVAAVIPKNESSGLEEAIHDYCKNELPEYMRPDVIWRIDALPLTTSGKPDRCALRERYVGCTERSRAAAEATGAV